jgi:hypothetical protein
MRPAFTEQSLGWSSLVEKLTPEERAALLAQRDAERLAVLSWVRAGANRSSYESDNYLSHDRSIAGRITPHYLVEAQTTPPHGMSTQVKIRSILADRCATCHSETGRNEKARWIPLDAYESLEPYCRVPPAPAFWASWTVVSLLFLIAVTLPAGAVFYLTSRPQWLQAVLVSISWLAAAVLAGAWLVGQPGGPALYILLAAAGAATMGTLTMITLTLSELVAGGDGPRRG